MRDCRPSCPPECLLHDLDGLDEAQAQGFRRACYPAHRVLFEQDDPCHKRIFLLCTGLIGRWWGQGELEKHCLEILGPGDWLGSECWQDDAWICRAYSLTDTSGWWVSEAQWLALLRHPGVLERFWRRQNQRLQDLHCWQVLLARGSVRARVAWQLLHLAERFGQASQTGEIFVAVHLTHEQQAMLVGATRPMVWKALQHFQQQGWLVCALSGFWIKNKEALISVSYEGS